MRPYSGIYDYKTVYEMCAEDFKDSQSVRFHFGVDNITMTETRKVIWLEGEGKGILQGLFVLNEEPGQGEGRLKISGMFRAYQTLDYAKRYLHKGVLIPVKINLKIIINDCVIGDGEYFIRNHPWGGSYWAPVYVPFESCIFKKGSNTFVVINNTPDSTDDFTVYGLDKVSFEMRPLDSRPFYIFSSPEYIIEGEEFLVRLYYNGNDIPVCDFAELPIKLLKVRDDVFFVNIWVYRFKSICSSGGGKIVFKTAIGQMSAFIRGILPQNCDKQALIGIGHETMLFSEYNDMICSMLTEGLGNYILLNPDGALNDGHFINKSRWLKLIDFLRENKIYFSIFPVRDVSGSSITVPFIQQIRNRGSKYFYSYHVHELGNLTWLLPNELKDFKDRKNEFNEGVFNKNLYYHWGKCITEQIPFKDGLIQNAESSLFARYMALDSIDIPIAEISTMNQSLHLSATRGIAKAFGKNTFGVMSAFLWHGGVGQRYACDEALANRVRLSLFSAYICGAKLIFPQSEIFRYFQVYSSQSASLRKDYEKGFNHPDVKRLRKVISELNSFTKLHSIGSPEVKIGIVMGNLDGYAGYGSFKNSWGYKAHENDSSNRGYLLIDEYFPGIGILESEQEGKYRRWFTGTPYGQVDLVPVEENTVGLESYKLLSFLGWNTMNEIIYNKLHEYVKQGGTLFISTPHFRVDTKPGMKQNLFKDGNFTEFLGFSVVGRGNVIYKAKILDEGFGNNIYTFVEKNVGYMTKEEATIQPEDLFIYDIELKGAEVIAEETDGKQPLLLRNRIGKGEVYVLNTYSYPGKYELRSFVRNILKTLSKRCLPEILVEDAPEVIQSFFTEGELTHAYFLSTRWWCNENVPCNLKIGTKNYSFEVNDNKVRVVSVLSGIGISPIDEWTGVKSFKRTSEGFECDLFGWGESNIDIFSPNGLIQFVIINGKEVKVNKSRIVCYLNGKEKLKIVYSKKIYHPEKQT